MAQNELEKLWYGLNNVPINDKDQIDEDYDQWKKGTDIKAIWDWFDEKFPNGLGAYLDS